MAINFDALPTENKGSKPAPGRYAAEISRTEINKSKNGNKQLVVTFKLAGGGSVNEYYQDSDKDFMLYKLHRLLVATGVTLQGTGTLEDIEKLIRNKKVQVQVTLNDNDFTNVDYSKGSEGLYPPGVPTNNEEAPNTVASQVIEAIGEGDIEDF